MSVIIQGLNGDSIPDLIVTNQVSNEVSLPFGSWDGSGNGVGTAGPRLKSGGSLHQRVITNGLSGTLAV